MRAKSQEKEAVFIEGQVTKLVHGQGVGMPFGVVLLNFLEKRKEKKKITSIFKLNKKKKKKTKLLE